MERNWQGPGILLDFGDYNSPVDQWYEGRGACDPCLSAEVLVNRKRVEERLCKEWDKKAELRQRGIKTTEEEVRAEKKRQASRETAICVERGYQANPWYTPYFDRKFKHTMFLYATRLVSLSTYCFSQQSVQKKSGNRNLRRTLLPPSKSQI